MIPKLRFDGYKGNWVKTKLYDATTKIGDGIHSTPQYDEEGDYFFINGNNLENGSIIINDTTKKINHLEYSKYNQQLGDSTILLSINGTIGNIAFYSDEKVLLGKSAAFINIDTGKYDRYFLSLILRTESVMKNFLKNLTGSTIKNLSLGTIRNTSFYSPCSYEQKKIADFFYLLNLKIQKQQEKVGLLKEQKKGFMQKIFSREMRLKDEDGKKFPEWEGVKLNEIASFKRGTPMSKKDIIDVGYPAIFYGELYTTYGEVINEVRTMVNVNKSRVITSTTQDVLIPSSGETAFDIATATAVNIDNIIIGSDINIVRLKEGINNIFLSYQLNTLQKKEMFKKAQGSSVVHLYSEAIKDIFVFLPTLKEQRKIANFLYNIDRKIETEAKKITVLKEQKKGFMQQMFV
ncbi:Type I restriction-modification system, specificity subunit S [Bacillus freudenreichii]|nr:Type I restriction-modification system, specificity subunit S [Bacillus freudenreichii]